MLFALAGCNQPALRHNELSKIEVAVAGGMMKWPAWAVSFDDNLNCYYYGGNKAKLKGYYSGKITSGFWDTLNIKLEQNKFTQLDTSVYWPLDDQAAEAIFYWGKQKRRVFLAADDSLNGKENVLKWIAFSYQHIKLYKMQDSVNFDVKILFSKPEFARKKIEIIKFPPTLKAHDHSTKSKTRGQL